MNINEIIENGKTSLGIEFGSTRIKAVLIDEKNVPIASGSYEWENQLENGIWTYSLEKIDDGLKSCYKSLCDEVQKKYAVQLTNVGSIGFSGMMHGYMAFDKDGKLLVPFRTWRNAITGQAAEILTKEFQFNIPQRWSIAHLYQAILNGEEHTQNIDYITTLAGYIHWKLTGKKVLGIGEASGMFPVDPKTKNYNKCMLDKFNKLVEKYNFKWKVSNILPQIMLAGENAGTLTEDGAKFLDVSGKLQAGISLCPPEGDAQTGMAATNSVAVRTGNVSAGTSVFAMVVLEKELKKVYSEIDVVTTPTGNDVAMVHCNNCTSDLNAWVNLFGEFLHICNVKMDKNNLFEVLYKKSLEGKADCDGLMAYNYFSGENITDVNEGRPLFMRSPKADFNIANFMRALLYSSLSTLKIGTDILLKEEGVVVDKIYGHGGLFKTEGVGQKFLSAALNTPVTVMDTAGEGGAWGIALLAAYMKNKNENESFEDFLQEKVFSGKNGSTLLADENDVKGFDMFVESYKKCIETEKTAVKVMSVDK